ncbi:hypothetical protein [Mycolicibacterium baixiangningiae]|uniref:hypothetical protein n=1 Tax=Mycolicibacterium baixiangningiae TaxID=2761578 RepID=UPI0018D0799B|nr:hypothetical protein [Mycolicibacterium baixiangningiae]
MIRSRWLTSLDAHGTGDPDFNEGHPEDRCPLSFCGRGSTSTRTGRTATPAHSHRLQLDRAADVKTALVDL